MKITVDVNDEAFRFTSMKNWVNTAKKKFEHHGAKSYNTISIDKKGRICTCGAHFSRADKENTYPIIVYWIGM